jgi:hypothetical protein
MHGTVLGDLTIDVEEPAPDRLVLRWKGASNTRDPGSALKTFFDVIFAEAAKRQAVVEQRFEALTFFNSSTVSALLRLVTEAGRLGLPMTLHYDGSLRWQAHNFEGIAALSSSLPFLKVVSVGEWPAVEQVSLKSTSPQS